MDIIDFSVVGYLDDIADCIGDKRVPAVGNAVSVKKLLGSAVRIADGVLRIPLLVFVACRIDISDDPIAVADGENVLGEVVVDAVEVVSTVFFVSFCGRIQRVFSCVAVVIHTIELDIGTHDKHGLVGLTRVRQAS